jgi:hypothetical protein
VAGRVEGLRKIGVYSMTGIKSGLNRVIVTRPETYPMAMVFPRTSLHDGRYSGGSQRMLWLFHITQDSSLLRDHNSHDGELDGIRSE